MGLPRAGSEERFCWAATRDRPATQSPSQKYSATCALAVASLGLGQQAAVASFDNVLRLAFA